MKWDRELKNKNTIQAVIHLIKNIERICKKNVPQKKIKENTDTTSKEMRRYKKRVKELKRKMRKANTEDRTKELEIKIAEAEKMMISEKLNKKLEKERIAIENMNKNPKLLYSIMNKKREGKI